MYITKNPMAEKAAKFLTDYYFINENPTHTERYEAYQHALGYCESDEVTDEEILYICEEYTNRLKSIKEN